MTFVLGGDLPVGRLGFGAMRLTSFRPPAGAERAAAVAVARRAVELGVTLIDTADFYGLGANEELLAEALHPYADDLVIATKVGAVRASPSDWTAIGDPVYLRQQAELCLRRLRVERIDLLQLHQVDPRVPLADQVGALAQLRTEGKVRHIGLSGVTVAQLDEAVSVVPIASVQNAYSLADRRSEDVLARTEELGIAFLPFQPLAAVRDPTTASRLGGVAGEVGATPAQVALAWLLERSAVLLPIPGTTTVAHLEENVAAREVGLTPEHMAVLDGAAVV
jgi:aryl-alcohol dehydrogenase-like predicted oxidoreductase